MGVGTFQTGTIIDEVSHRVVAPCEEGHVQREAEAQCDFFLHLFKALAERIRDKLGSEALGPELSACLAAFDSGRIRDFSGTVDSVVAKGAVHNVVRELRMLTGFTRDQVYELIEQWPGLRPEQKANWCVMQFKREAYVAKSEHKRTV
ncbi:MAG: hypothetical protein L0Y70_15805 [Gemmataceae bacterium]|nr:hypothetical protein [Gemmataceae bacterium]